MSQPPHPPPSTPGPIRIHRPSYINPMAPNEARFHPYGARTSTPTTPDILRQPGDENCPPTTGTSSFSPSPFTSSSLTMDHPRASTGLRRWSSMSAFGDPLNNGLDGDSTLGDEPRALPDMMLTKVNRLIDQFDLWVEKDKIYNFVELPSQDRELVMYLNLLKLQTQLHLQSETFSDFSTQVLQLKKYVSGNWVPSKTQQELLSQLLGHWLIKPLQSYDRIYHRVRTFVHVRAEWLHLGVYVIDPIARSVIDKYIQKAAGDMKGTFRKEIVASIKEPKSLNDFARAMLQKYHCPVIPNEPPRDVLANLAFLRAIALECQNDTTKFWRRVEVVLGELYDEKKNGNKRDTDARWKIWEDNVIAEDQAKYSSNPQDTRLAHATSRDAFAESDSSVAPPSLADEMDAAAAESSVPTAMFNMYRASAIPVNIPDHAMDGDVELSSLGNVARTMEITQ